MHKSVWFVSFGLAVALARVPAVRADARPYIGFAYPAGGRQGTTFQTRVGGQGLDDVDAVLVTGAGVTGRVIECYRRLSGQEPQLLGEQLRALKPTNAVTASTMAPAMTAETPMTMMGGMTTGATSEPSAKSELIATIEKRIDEFVQTPACVSITTLVMLEVSIAPDATPEERELRLVTRRGVSNPLSFQVGQLPEFSRKPMRAATLAVLGKEAQSLRKRPPEEAEDRITLPCTANGQIASGEVNRCRFTARKGQRLVLTIQARQLIPYIADAVPGWFQPVLALYDANGRELAYNDRYRFKPDPTLFFEVSEDGEYVFAIYDSLYRGREDFVYRVTAGELPYVTSIFPLGGRMGIPVAIRMKGWNLQDAKLSQPARDAPAGVYQIAATRKGFVSNRVPFALDTLPECFEKEPNDDLAHAQRVKLPVIVNGRIERPDDWDVFRFAGKSNDTVVVEVYARRLDSPLDSVLKLSDAAGKLLVFNDDREDPESGLNTHHADSHIMARLPADGIYHVHIGDAARQGGEEYAYRLRISAPRPDFALRVVPSSAGLRGKSGTFSTVYAIRRDGFCGAIKLGLKDPPPGFSSTPATLTETQTVAQMTVRTDLATTKEPLNVVVEGRSKIGGQEVAHEGVPAEDRMQAFLWRHLVPAADLKIKVFDPTNAPPSKHVPPVCPPSAIDVEPAVGTNMTTTSGAPSAVKSKFTKQQAAGRLRDLKRLYEDGLLTDEFYLEKAAECEAAQESPHESTEKK